MGDDDAKDLDDIFDANGQDDDFDLDDFGGDGSIHPLTLKGGEEEDMYPEGFGEEDDLNKDGRIDQVEHQLKVN